MADLEHILQQLHDSEINAGVYDAGMRVWIGDEANGIQAETTINRTAAARLKWPEGLNCGELAARDCNATVPRQQICQEPLGLSGHSLSRSEPGRSALVWRV
jgi:hypothetical protein